MRKLLILTVALAVLNVVSTGFLLFRSFPRHQPANMIAHIQGGPVVDLGDPDDEDDWLGAAQRLADERGEAVAVVQGGKFVALVNPQR